jgi:hypothetical protein
MHCAQCHSRTFVLASRQQQQQPQHAGNRHASTEQLQGLDLHDVPMRSTVYIPSPLPSAPSCAVHPLCHPRFGAPWGQAQRSPCRTSAEGKWENQAADDEHDASAAKLLI